MGEVEEPRLTAGGSLRILWPIQDTQQGLVPFCRTLLSTRRQLSMILQVLPHCCTVMQEALGTPDAGRRYRKLASIRTQFSILLHVLPNIFASLREAAYFAPASERRDFGAAETTNKCLGEMTL